MVKNLPANAGDVSLIPASGSFPGQENGDLFQYFCLENPMDRGAWWTIIHGVTKKLVTKQQQQLLTIVTMYAVHRFPITYP